MNRRQQWPMALNIKGNAFASVLEVVATALSLLLLYHYILIHLGPESVGLWSLVTATTSAAGIADLGLANGVVRFVASATANGQREGPSDYLLTAFTSIAVLYLAAILVFYWPIAEFLEYMVDGEAEATAIGILPFAMLSLWLTCTGSILLNGLVGIHRSYWKSIIRSVAGFLLLSMSLMLMKEHGLLGLLYSQIIQSGFILCSSWFLLLRYLKGLPLLPIGWRLAAFKDLVRYGIGLQISGIFQLLFDPTTKILLGNFANLETVGLFEAANRCVMQARNAIVSANLILVPTFADLKETAPDAMHRLYRGVSAASWWISAIAMGFLVSHAPYISSYWLGVVSDDFLLFLTILSGAWLIDLVSVPAFFLGMGEGDVRGNIYGQILHGVVNILVGLVLGALIGSIGVVLGFVFALLAGGIVNFLYNDLRLADGAGCRIFTTMAGGFLFVGLVTATTRTAYPYLAFNFGISLAAVLSVVVYVTLILVWTVRLLRSDRLGISPLGGTARRAPALVDLRHQGSGDHAPPL